MFTRGCLEKTKGDFSNTCGNSKYVTFKNIHENNFSIKNLGSVYISDDEKQNYVLHGDILITGTSENREEIATPSLFLDRISDLYLNSFSYGLRPETGFDSKFLYYYLRTSFIRKKIISMGQGITRINLSPEKLKSIEFLVPHIYEQVKFGNFLNCLENEIYTFTDLKKKYILRKKYITNAIFA